jgi:hypothetical protein
MKQHERQIVTTFRWWRGDDKPVVDKHIAELNTHAVDRIAIMSLEGYSSGELLTRIGGVDYSGWWVSGTKDNDD